MAPVAALPQLPALNLVPGAPQPYLTTFRLVTYYGSPLGWGLGILGESDRDSMTQDLRQLAGQYQAMSADRAVLRHIVRDLEQNLGIYATVVTPGTMTRLEKNSAMMSWAMPLRWRYRLSSAGLRVSSQPMQRFSADTIL